MLKAEYVTDYLIHYESCLLKKENRHDQYEIRSIHIDNTAVFCKSKSVRIAEDSTNDLIFKQTKIPGGKSPAPPVYQMEHPLAIG